MAIMEITVLPKTETVSVSARIADIIQYLKDSGIKFTLTPMSTIIEGNVDFLLKTAGSMHSIPFSKGVQRVYTVIKIDDRKDKELTAVGKVAAVMEKLEKGDVS